MSKKKIIILIGIIVILCILIFTVILTILINRDDLSSSPLYGKWMATSSEIFENGLIVYLDEIIEDKYIIISKSNIKICYIENNKEDCKKVKYTYNDNVMSIEENDMYLSGKEVIYLNDDNLSMKYTIQGDNNYSIIHFKRE